MHQLPLLDSLHRYVVSATPLDRLKQLASSALISAYLLGTGVSGQMPALASSSLNQMQQGIQAYRTGEYQQALSILTPLHETYPYDANVTYYMGLSLGKLGKKEQAKSLYQHILKTAPNTLAATMASAALGKLSPHSVPSTTPVSTVAATRPRTPQAATASNVHVFKAIPAAPASSAFMHTSVPTATPVSKPFSKPTMAPTLPRNIDQQQAQAARIPTRPQPEANRVNPQSPTLSPELHQILNAMNEPPASASAQTSPTSPLQKEGSPVLTLSALSGEPYPPPASDVGTVQDSPQPNYRYIPSTTETAAAQNPSQNPYNVPSYTPSSQVPQGSSPYPQQTIQNTPSTTTTPSGTPASVTPDANTQMMQNMMMMQMMMSNGNSGVNTMGGGTPGNGMNWMLPMMMTQMMSGQGNQNPAGNNGNTTQAMPGFDPEMMSSMLQMQMMQGLDMNFSGNNDDNH